MGKRAYIFYLLILICGFATAFFAGVKMGGKEHAAVREKVANANPQEETKSPADGYWVKSVDGIICVYEEDGTTVVAETDIDVSNFSEREKNILKDGIYLENAEELFKYLENNTS